MSQSKKVLIITYYWPPSGGSGVQRWLKFVKYLPSYGWEPYVFTPENPSFAVKDPSLNRDVPTEAEIIHFPIWEPYEVFERLKFSKQKNKVAIDLPNPERDSLFKKVATWIRGNFFIPDPRRFWVRPSVNFLESFLKDNRIKTVITTGPPHSMHLIGLRLKKKNPSLHWIADFRDPWSEWGFLDSLRMTDWARQIHKKLEHQVLRNADLVTTITPFYVRHFERLGGRVVNLLTNGFDEDDFQNVKITRDKKFIVRHVGIINERCNPRPFIDMLAQICSQRHDLAEVVELQFIGQVHGPVQDYALKHLPGKVSFIATMPHKELLKIYGSSGLLLLVLHGYKDAEGYMPGKLFEYLATDIPVVGVGPASGDAANLLSQSGAGKMYEHTDYSGMKNAVLHAFENWQKGFYAQTNSNRLQYSRRTLTGELVKLLRS